jgi:hypothetical protein
MLMLGMPILTPGTVNALSLLSINRLSIYKLPNLRIVVGLAGEIAKHQCNMRTLLLHSRAIHRYFYPSTKQLAPHAPTQESAEVAADGLARVHGQTTVPQ